MDEPRRRAFGFWATLAVTVPLLYPASFGPACWLADWGLVSHRHVVQVFEPFVRHANPHMPKGVLPVDCLKWYATAGARKDSKIVRELTTAWTDLLQERRERAAEFRR